MDLQFVTPDNRRSTDDGAKTYPHQVYEDYLADFLVYLNDVNNRRVQNQIIPSTLPFFTMTTHVVELVCSICSSFGMPPEVKYLALEIFERFTTFHFSDLWKYIQKTSTNHSIQMKHWHRLLPRAKKQALLRVLGSIQIASKFILQSSALSGAVVQQFLTKCGHAYSLKSVYHSEIRIFSSLNCQLPVHSVYDFMTTLLEVLKHWTDVEHLISTCEKVLNYSFLQREEIYVRFFWLSTGRWQKSYHERVKFAAVELNNFLLSSAVIVSSLFIRKFHDLSPHKVCEIFSDISNISANDICGLAIIITQTALGCKAIDFSSYG